MINEFIREIGKFIKLYYPKATCYKDIIQQNFKEESFLIECIHSKVEEKIHNIFNLSYTFSITYFSSSQSSIIDVLTFLDLELHDLLQCKVIEKEIVDVNQDKGTLMFTVNQRLRKTAENQILIENLKKIKGV